MATSSSCCAPAEPEKQGVRAAVATPKSGYRHLDAGGAQELADQCRKETDVRHACSECYGYELLVLRAR